MTDEPAWEQVAQCVAKRWAHTVMGYDDALQHARLGAWQASQRFDPDQGTNEFQWCWNRANGAVLDAHRKLRGVRQYRNSKGVMVESRRIPETVALGLGGDDWGDGYDNHIDYLDVPVTDVEADECIDVESLITSIAATQRERYLLTAIALDQSQADVARHFGLTESRVSQMMRDLRQRAINLGVTV